MSRGSLWKKITLTVFLVFIISISGCVKKQLVAYEVKNADEKEIIQTLLDYQNTVNAYEFEKVPNLFTSNGICEGLPVKEYFSTATGLEKMKKHKCKISMKEPNFITVNGKKAQAEIYRTIDCINKPMTYLWDFEKIDGIWKIAKLGAK